MYAHLGMDKFVCTCTSMQRTFSKLGRFSNAVPEIMRLDEVRSA